MQRKTLGVHSLLFLFSAQTVACASVPRRTSARDIIYSSFSNTVSPSSLKLKGIFSTMVFIKGTWRFIQSRRLTSDRIQILAPKFKLNCFPQWTHVWTWSTRFFAQVMYGNWNWKVDIFVAYFLWKMYSYITSLASGRIFLVLLSRQIRNFSNIYDLSNFWTV